MSLVNEIHTLLTVHVERHLSGTESLELTDHVLHVVCCHAQLTTEIHVQFDVRTENLNVAVLVVLVTLCCIEVY